VLKLTENVAQVFMGMRIQCAQCHNHPFDRWTMDDYYGFAAFFAQVKRKPAEDPRERIVFDGGGEVQHPVTKQPNIPPKFLGGGPPNQRQVRRKAVADGSPRPTTRGSPATSPTSSGRTSSASASSIRSMTCASPTRRPTPNCSTPSRKSSLFRIQLRLPPKLVRDICTSRTYQLSTRTNETNATDTRNFSHAMVRRVRAEVLLDCISQVTDTPNKFKGLPLGARAVQIADGNTSNYFLTTFGRATRATVCSCEVKMEPNLSQALHLLNGDTTQQRIRQGKVVENPAHSAKARRQIIAPLPHRLSRAHRHGMEKLLAAVAGDRNPPRRAWRMSSGRCSTPRSSFFNH
jgi:hypothetical protein